MNTVRATLFALLALPLSSLLPAAEPPVERFDDVRTQARQMGETEEGKAYEKRFSEVFAEPMRVALMECTKDTKPPYKVNFVFVIGADGTTQRILPAPEQPVSACVANKLKSLKLPAPPRPGWMVGVNITVEE